MELVLCVRSASCWMSRVLPHPGGPSNSSGRSAHNASAAARKLRMTVGVPTNAWSSAACPPALLVWQCVRPAMAPLLEEGGPLTRRGRSTPHTLTKPRGSGNVTALAVDCGSCCCGCDALLAAPRFCCSLVRLCLRRRFERPPLAAADPGPVCAERGGGV